MLNSFKATQLSVGGPGFKPKFVFDFRFDF